MTIEDEVDFDWYKYFEWSNLDNDENPHLLSYSIKTEKRASGLAEKIRDWYAWQMVDRKFYVARSIYMPYDEETGEMIVNFKIKSRNLIIPMTYAEVRYIKKHRLSHNHGGVEIYRRKLHGDIKSQIRALQGNINDYIGDSVQTNSQ